MATIKDVAQAADVSLGTVSNYLNGNVPVAEETALRVQTAIDSLGYQVNLGARALRSKQTRSVGFVVPDISNPFYAEVARATEHTPWEQGFQMFLCDSARDEEWEAAYLNTLVKRQVDGVLMIYARERTGLGEVLERAKVPCVFIDRDYLGATSVTTDNYLGGQLAARHLTALGHTRIGMLVGGRDVRNIQERLRGFRDELSANGVGLDERYILYGAQTLELGLRVTELLELDPAPTALFTTNDVVAIGAWRTLLERGVRIPEDVSLVGFDDIKMSSLLVPPLTTVAQDKTALGREAVRALLGLIDGRDVVGTTQVAPRLVVRGSSARNPSARNPSARNPSARNPEVKGGGS